MDALGDVNEVHAYASEGIIDRIGCGTLSWLRSGFPHALGGHLRLKVAFIRSMIIVEFLILFCFEWITLADVKDYRLIFERKNEERMVIDAVVNIEMIYFYEVFWASNRDSDLLKPSSAGKSGVIFLILFRLLAIKPKTFENFHALKLDCSVSKLTPFWLRSWSQSDWA